MSEIIQTEGNQMTDSQMEGGQMESNQQENGQTEVTHDRPTWLRLVVIGGLAGMVILAVVITWLVSAKPEVTTQSDVTPPPEEMVGRPRRMDDFTPEIREVVEPRPQEISVGDAISISGAVLPPPPDDNISPSATPLVAPIQ